MYIYKQTNGKLAYVSVNTEIISPENVHTQIPNGVKFKFIEDSVIEENAQYLDVLDYDIENDYDGIGTRGGV